MWTLIYLLIMLILIGGVTALFINAVRRDHDPDDPKHKRKPKPEHKISLLVPFTTDNARREINWRWLEKYWQAHLPNAEILMGDNDDRPYNKTMAVNHAFTKAKGDIIVILDADCYIDAKIISECAERIRAARKAGRHLWFIPYRRFYRLTERATNVLLRTDPRRPMMFPDPPPRGIWDSPNPQGVSASHWYGAMIQVMPREAFEAAGGMDERFVGWGGEDISFMHAVDAMYGRHKTTKNSVFHLWHPRTQGSYKTTALWEGQTTDSTINYKITAEYWRARNQPDKMAKVIRTRYDRGLS